MSSVTFEAAEAWKAMVGKGHPICWRPLAVTQFPTVWKRRRTWLNQLTDSTEPSLITKHQVSMTEIITEVLPFIIKWLCTWNINWKKVTLLDIKLHFFPPIGHLWWNRNLKLRFKLFLCVTLWFKVLHLCNKNTHGTIVYHFIMFSPLEGHLRGHCVAFMQDNGVWE